MSNQTQTLEQMIKRIVGAAFDAGVQAATRPRAERDRQRIDQADFAAVMIRGQVDAERLKATTDQLEADFLNSPTSTGLDRHVAARAVTTSNAA
jgi:hypothetical protein